jgi:hypothetical protein
VTGPQFYPTSPKTSGYRTRLNTVGPHLENAGLLVEQLRQRLEKQGNKRLFNAFTALADGDQAVGLLAFYLWRRNARRRG